MTEEEAEETLMPVFTPELLPEQKFHVMVKEANLDESRAGYLLKQFSEHFKDAAEYAKKAKHIIVTNENQTVLMEQARVARLFLSKKRQDIEKDRKWMKEPSLREGQAIDKISNFLKDTIIPTEEHLRRQEDFIKLRQEAEAKRIRLEIEAKIEAERIAKEEADRKALAMAQAENDKLRKEQSEHEKVLAVERAKQEAILSKERAIQEAQLAKERAEREKLEEELRKKRQAEMKAEADRIKAEERAKSAGDNDKLIALHKVIAAIHIPEVKSKESIRMVENAKSYLSMALKSIIINEEE